MGPRISIYSGTGEIVAGLGQGPAELELGQFISPHGLARDSRGDIYVGDVSLTDWGNCVRSQPTRPGCEAWNGSARYAEDRRGHGPASDNEDLLRLRVTLVLSQYRAY